MPIELSEIDRTTLASLMNVKEWLTNRAAEIDNQVWFLLLTTYDVNVKKGDWTLDLQRGVIARVATTEPSGQ